MGSEDSVGGSGDILFAISCLIEGEGGESRDAVEEIERGAKPPKAAEKIIIDLRARRLTNITSSVYLPLLGILFQCIF